MAKAFGVRKNIQFEKFQTYYEYMREFLIFNNYFQGDSGGPLQLNLMRKNRKHFRYYLIGMTSYGTFCRSAYPGVYTRVSSYIAWITSVVWPDQYSSYFPEQLQ